MVKSMHGKPGRPPKLSGAQVEALIAIVRERPFLSLDDVVQEFRKRTGVALSGRTVHKYLTAAGIRRERPLRTRLAVPAPSGPAETQAPARYGYTAAHRDRGDAARYPCGLTDAEWEQVRPIFDPEGRPGRPERHPRRTMLDACVYVLRSGCSWRMLPKEFPSWSVVYPTFRRWQAKGLFENLYDELRALWRTREHRAPEPTGAVLDSQSVKTSPQGGEKGFDAGKKVKGRKRHLVTDTLGLLLAVLVTAASVQDRDAADSAVALAKAKVPSVSKLYVDGGYGGQCASSLREKHGLDVEVVRHPANRNVGRWVEGQLPLFDVPQGFVVLPKRWVVERTHAWNDRPRRLAKDHDRSLGVSAAWIWLAEARRLLRRVTTAELAA